MDINTGKYIEMIQANSVVGTPQVRVTPIVATIQSDRSDGRLTQISYRGFASTISWPIISSKEKNLK